MKLTVFKVIILQQMIHDYEFHNYKFSLIVSLDLTQLFIKEQAINNGRSTKATFNE